MVDNELVLSGMLLKLPWARLGTRFLPVNSRMIPVVQNK